MNELVAYVVRTQAMEGIQCTAESIERMERVVAGELSADEAVEEVKRGLGCNPSISTAGGRKESRANLSPSLPGAKRLSPIP